MPAPQRESLLSLKSYLECFARISKPCASSWKIIGREEESEIVGNLWSFLNLRAASYQRRGASKPYFGLKR